MGKGSSSSSTSNFSTTENFANYGDGVQINGEGNTVNYLDKDVAITAIHEAGMFAENAASMNLSMQENNADLVAGFSGKADSMTKLVTFISVGTIAAVLIIGARKG